MIDPGWIVSILVAVLASADKYLTARAQRRLERERAQQVLDQEPRTDYVDHSLEGLKVLTAELRVEREELRREGAELRSELGDAAREIQAARVQLGEARAEIQTLRLQLAQAGFELAAYRAHCPSPPHHHQHATQPAPPAG